MDVMQALSNLFSVMQRDVGGVPTEIRMKKAVYDRFTSCFEPDARFSSSAPADAYRTLAYLHGDNLIRFGKDGE